MSNQESRAISELRRRNRSLFARVEELKASLVQQIKVDSGKASHVCGPLNLRLNSDGKAVGTKRG